MCLSLRHQGGGVAASKLLNLGHLDSNLLATHDHVPTPQSMQASLKMSVGGETKKDAYISKQQGDERGWAGMCNCHKDQMIVNVALRSHWAV